MSAAEPGRGLAVAGGEITARDLWDLLAASYLSPADGTAAAVLTGYATAEAGGQPQTAPAGPPAWTARPLPRR